MLSCSSGNRAGARFDRQVRVLNISLEPLQDWTIRTMVATAGLDEDRQRMNHILKAFDLLFQVVDVAFCQTLDLSALSGFVAP